MGSLSVLAHWTSSSAAQEMESTIQPWEGTIGCWIVLGQTTSLPLHFLSKDNFTQNENPLGTFLDYDNSYVTSSKKSMARILMYLDTIEGLEE